MFRRPRNGTNGSGGADGPAPASEHLIDLRAVVKDYVTDAGPFRALDGVDLQVDRGEFIAVVGRSGCGKSTLMNMITGIDRATGGTVTVAGQDLAGLSEGKTAEWRGRTIGVIFQFFQLLPTLTVVENVMLPMDFGGLWTPRERFERAMELLDRVGMADQARKLPSSTSGGQQQRVAIARALANDPPLIVADEPTGNLDSATADVVFAQFESLVDQGRTIVTVTHDAELAPTDATDGPHGRRHDPRRDARARPTEVEPRVRSVRWRKALRDLGEPPDPIAPRRALDRRRRVRGRHDRGRQRDAPVGPHERLRGEPALVGHDLRRTVRPGLRRQHPEHARDRRCRGPPERRPSACSTTTARTARCC